MSSAEGLLQKLGKYRHILDIVIPASVIVAVGLLLFWWWRKGQTVTSEGRREP